MGSGDKTMMEKAHMRRFSESVTLARRTGEVSRMIRLQGVLATLAALPLVAYAHHSFDYLLSDAGRAAFEAYDAVLDDPALQCSPVSISRLRWHHAPITVHIKLIPTARV